MNNTSTFAQVFNERLLVIPDYQRGYSWGERQWNDFLEDLEMLPPDREHYTGTLVLHRADEQRRRDIEGNVHRVFQVVDGQQRLTTVVLFLDGLRRRLAQVERRQSMADGIRKQFIRVIDENDSPLYKLRLNSDANEFFEAAILGDNPSVLPPTIRSHERLLGAQRHFEKFFLERQRRDPDTFESWLTESHEKVTQRLMVTVYEVSDTSDVGVIFETMNNRGKPLSELEKVKNYLLYIAAKLDLSHHDLDGLVNRTWTRILEQLMQADLVQARDEDQLLRCHWLFAYNPDVRSWDGSRSIKQRFDLRNYRGRGQTRDKTLLQEVSSYLEVLRDTTVAFCDAYNPQHPSAFASFASDSDMRREIAEWSERLARIGVIAQFIPLLVSTRLRFGGEPDKYLDLLKLLERFAFRVFKVAGRRSNSGGAGFYRLAYRVFHEQADKVETEGRVLRMLERYCGAKTFREFFEFDPDENDRYSWGGIKYLLYEYETHLAQAKRKKVRLPWAKVAKRNKELTIEHVLPQTPTKQYWTTRFHKREREIYTHDLGNLSLTEDNSSYSNKPFPDKRGEPGQESPCYVRSNIFMEQDLAAWTDWTQETVAERRERIVEWALERWATAKPPTQESAGDDSSIEDEDEDEAPPQPRRTAARGNKKLMVAAIELLTPMLSDLVATGRLREKETFWVYGGRYMVTELKLPTAGDMGLDVIFEALGGGPSEIGVRFYPRGSENRFGRGDTIRTYGDEVCEALQGEFGDATYHEHHHDDMPAWVLPQAPQIDSWTAEAIADHVARVVRTLASIIPFEAA